MCLRVDAEWGTEVCTASCSVDADCSADTTCGVGPTGERACVPDACRASGRYYDYVCRDGESVACEQVRAGEHCESCGCRDPSLRCSPDGCVPLSDVGGECSRDSDCLTNNCSSIEFVCRVPVGSTCDSSNCDRCLVHESGWRFCSRSCDHERECNGSRCIGNSTEGYTCRAGCDGCPSRCRPISGEAPYCDCFDCEIEYSTSRDLYSLCGADSTCASGACVGRGMCTRTCVADADCGELGVCAMVPCAPGQATACGSVCLQACDALTSCRAGSCLELAGISGMVSACDPRLADGARCIAARDCRSGRCIDTICRPADGLENGSGCARSDDCRSGNCLGGTCRGTSLIGQSCEDRFDCAAGTCCDGVCRAECT